MKTEPSDAENNSQGMNKYQFGSLKDFKINVKLEPIDEIPENQSAESKGTSQISNVPLGIEPNEHWSMIGKNPNSAFTSYSKPKRIGIQYFGVGKTRLINLPIKRNASYKSIGKNSESGGKKYIKEPEERRKSAFQKYVKKEMPESCEAEREAGGFAGGPLEALGGARPKEFKLNIKQEIIEREPVQLEQNVGNLMNDQNVVWDYFRVIKHEVVDNGIKREPVHLQQNLGPVLNAPNAVVQAAINIRTIKQEVIENGIKREPAHVQQAGNPSNIRVKMEIGQVGLGVNPVPITNLPTWNLLTANWYQAQLQRGYNGMNPGSNAATLNPHVFHWNQQQWLYFQQLQQLHFLQQQQLRQWQLLQQMQNAHAGIRGNPRPAPDFTRNCSDAYSNRNTSTRAETQKKVRRNKKK